MIVIVHYTILKYKILINLHLKKVLKNIKEMLKLKEVLKIMILKYILLSRQIQLNI